MAGLFFQMFGSYATNAQCSSTSYPRYCLSLFYYDLLLKMDQACSTQAKADKSSISAKLRDAAEILIQLHRHLRPTCQKHDQVYITHASSQTSSCKDPQFYWERDHVKWAALNSKLNGFIVHCRWILLGAFIVGVSFVGPLLGPFSFNDRPTNNLPTIGPPKMKA